VDPRQPPQAPQDVGDVRAEDAAVDVRLVDDDEAEVVEEVAPEVVAREDADVEHVRVREHEIRPAADLASPLGRRVSVVARPASASRTAGWSESGSGAGRASRAASLPRFASSSPTRRSSQTAVVVTPTIEAGYASLNSVSCSSSGVRSRALRPPHGGTTAGA